MILRGKYPFLFALRRNNRWEFSAGKYTNGVLDWAVYYRVHVGHLVLEIAWGDYRKSILRKIAKENLKSTIDEWGNEWIKVGYTHFFVASHGERGNHNNEDNQCLKKK